MDYLPRIIATELAELLEAAGAVLIEGPMAHGKTATAMRAAASGVSLDVDDNARRVIGVDPAVVLNGVDPAVVLNGDTPRSCSTVTPRSCSTVTPRSCSTATPRSRSTATPRSRSTATPRSCSTATPRSCSTATRRV